VRRAPVLSAMFCHRAFAPLFFLDSLSLPSFSLILPSHPHHPPCSQREPPPRRGNPTTRTTTATASDPRPSSPSPSPRTPLTTIQPVPVPVPAMATSTGKDPLLAVVAAALQSRHRNAARRIQNTQLALITAAITTMSRPISHGNLGIQMATLQEQ